MNKKSVYLNKADLEEVCHTMLLTCRNIFMELPNIIKVVQDNEKCRRRTTNKIKRKEK